MDIGGEGVKGNLAKGSEVPGGSKWNISKDGGFGME